MSSSSKRIPIPSRYSSQALSQKQSNANISNGSSISLSNTLSSIKSSASETSQLNDDSMMLTGACSSSNSSLGGISMSRSSSMSSRANSTVAMPKKINNSYGSNGSTSCNDVEKSSGDLIKKIEVR
jgi:hypothetical protein